MKRGKPDDYYNDGIFEIIRYGKEVKMINHMTDEMKTYIKGELVNNYDKYITEINDTINEIRTIVKKQNPEELLKMAVVMSKINYINLYSESQVTKDAIIATNTLRYIQAVIVSEKIYTSEFKEENYYKILELVKKLYSLVERFIISYCEKFNKNEDEIRLIQANFLYKYVTGKRYEFQEIKALKELLYPCANLFEKCFGFNIELFFEGMEKIQYAYTHGLNENIKMMHKMMENLSLDDINNNEKEKGLQIIDNIIGIGLHNVSKITDWPQNFLDRLSYEIGECKTFFDNSNYSGWPLFKNPLEIKPFIKLNGASYCFSIHDLFDNIYRIVLKNMRTMIPEENELINKIQGITAETIVGNLFSKIIPNSKILISNYYPLNKNNFAENDLMVMHDNNLILVEVKSGSYTPDFAVENFESNIDSIKSLIEKADNQNKRTLNYLMSKEQCPIYDSNKPDKIIKEIINLNNYNNIIKFCITVDSFNEIEAQAEKIKYCNLNDETIVISLDDFRIYAEYFSSPTKFFHFLKQRKTAITTEQIELNDELDHLGMYIDKNMYTLYAKSINANKIDFTGFREQIDKYFHSLYLKDKHIEKPEFKNPKIIEEIIKFCDKNIIHNSVFMTNYILDICIEDKEKLNEIIYKILRENNILQEPKTIFMSGEYSLITFIHKGDKRCKEEERNHSLATMKISNISEMLEMHLFFNNNLNIENIEFEFLKINDIKFDEEKINKISEKIKVQRLKRFINKKIGRNEICPCGIGKKYKKCCGK